MFSSINKLNICELNPKENINYKKIMLYRNINNKLISCFLNWMIRLPREKGLNNSGWLIPLLKNEKNFNFKQYIIKLFNLNDKNIISIFKQFLEILPNIYMKNPHLHPQTTILEKKKFFINLFINIDNKEDISLLEKIIKQKIPISNKSSYLDKELLLKFLEDNQYFNNIIQQIYYKDNKLINKINLNKIVSE